MKHTLSKILIGVILLTVISCQNDIIIEDKIDLKSPIEMTIMTTDSVTELSKSDRQLIQVDSEKYKRLTDFLMSNTRGWKSSPASYVCDLSLTQDDFRLLYWIGKDGVVIGFTDNAGDSRQYYKKIKLGELDFLIE